MAGPSPRGTAACPATLLLVILAALAWPVRAAEAQSAVPPVTAEPSVATPPPRSITDILAVLDKQKPDPATVAALQARIRAEPPAGAAPAERAAFHYERAGAADELGLYRQRRDDVQRAYEIARDNGLSDDALRYRQTLGRAEQNIGNLREAEHIYDELIATYEAAGARHRGRLFSMYTHLAEYAAQRGDFAVADRSLGKAEALAGGAGGQGGGGKGKGHQRGTVRNVKTAAQANILRARCSIAAARGQLDEALRDCRQSQVEMSEALADGSDDDPADIKDLRHEQSFDSTGAVIAGILRRQGRLMEAEIEARKALLAQLQRRGRYAPESAKFIDALAQVVEAEGRLAEAGKLYKAALDTLVTLGIGDGSDFMSSARTGYAQSLAAEGRFADAVAEFERVRRGLAEDPGLQLRRVDGNPAYDDALVRLGRAAEAAANLTRALERDPQRGRADFRVATLQGFRGLAWAAAGDRARAVADFDAALPALMSATTGDNEGSDGMSRRDLIRRDVLEAYLATLAEGAGTPLLAGRDVAADAFRIADAIRGQTVQRAVAQSSARAAARDPALAELARKEQDGEQQIGALYRLINDMLAEAPAQQDQKLMAALRAEIETLRSARAATRKEIELRFPAYARLIDPRPATVEEARAALLPGEALIATYIGEDRSYVWAVPKQGAVAFQTPKLGRAALAELVAGLRRSLDPAAATVGQIPAFDQAAAYRLYGALLEPVKPGWAGAKVLVVVPHGPLGQIPFSVLVTDPAPLRKEGSGEVMFGAYKSVPFLIRRAAITQLPSVASLVTLRAEPPAPQGRRPFIGFGDPWFSPAEAAAAKVPPPRQGSAALQARGVPLRRRSAPATERVDSATLAELPRLPDTAEEVRSVAQALDADPARDVLLGAEANERAVRTADLAGRRVVMFATHGLVPGDLDGLDQPALALSAPSVAHVEGDGLLRMDEIVTLRLNADWVVLSACNTAAGQGAGAEAVSGLGRAFFYAGTRAVLVSNWPVETTSARLLTTDLFRRQAADGKLTRAEALRQAELALIDGDGALDPQSKRPLYSYAHPIFWAPFSLVGDGGGG